MSLLLTGVGGAGGIASIDPATQSPFLMLTGETIVYNAATNLYHNFPGAVVADGDTIGAWQDYGGTATYSPVQTTDALRAIWKASQQNGLGIVRPNGTTHFYTLNAAIPAASWNSFSIILVLKPGAQGANGSAILGANAVGEIGCFTIRVNSALKIEVLKSNTASLATSTTALSTSVFQVVGVDYDGATFNFYLNGAADGSASVATTFSVAGSGFFYDLGFSFAKLDFAQGWATAKKPTATMLAMMKFVSTHWGGLY